MDSLSQCATLACLWEATAPKAGNVHRGADFEDLSFMDFVTSAVAIGPSIEAAAMQPVGKCILEAIQATRARVCTNTNLGMVLLLAPLAAVPRNQTLDQGIGPVLHRLGPQDAAWIYEAIRLAGAGGMGRVEKHDLQGPPPQSILEAMALAAPRDLIARQYIEDFATVLQVVVPELKSALDRGWSMSNAIVHAQIRLLSRFPDSLIVRKCGAALAQTVSDRAGKVLAAGEPGDENYEYALADFDFWLRSDGHRRNPGTIADLIAAGLFVLLRNGEL